MPASQSNEGFPVSWTGRDDWNGVQNYDVQVSTDGGEFTAWLTGTTATTSNFQGSSGHSYSFGFERPTASEMWAPGISRPPTPRRPPSG